MATGYIVSQSASDNKWNIYYTYCSNFKLFQQSHSYDKFNKNNNGARGLRGKTV